MKKYTLDEVQDSIVGKKGSRSRNDFELELSLDQIGFKIKQVRIEKNLTQEALGKLVGVQKAQISKLESNSSNASISTIVRVFRAMNASVQFRVEMISNRSKNNGRKKLLTIPTLVA
ncbi:MAG: transcriptional regulator [Bacteroidetes bacterium 24-39-8]|jgi:DNA-binding XRE family transcriptional regulator|nr:MAG: transcriptional regulator [Sphingobacteriia bacterium 35-40-8]OYZ48371.1 MAG: transcriptional regulator [Bacteroidetes bacterium 24-39-8]OZA62189.1 MAG: transcriptional regulator [Sphingobacteriia bacterium 39-39-8]HQR94101.1 helix-turn-helix transcriptional regulator [Sediminibacterium sp.]HQS53997.1 helix-turn-helix transcriptional regulator [Sediminibacterium sp.]